MAAPDIDTIYQFESAIESAAESILDTAASITSHKQRDTVTLATPFAFCQLSGVQGIGKQYKTGTNAFNWPIDFYATLNVTVTTNRQENAASHATYLGKVRRHLYTLTNWTTQRLPYHQSPWFKSQEARLNMWRMNDSTKRRFPSASSL